MAAADFHGAQSARRETRAVKQYSQTPYPDVPLERVEIDHTRADLVVIDDRDNLPLGRLTLTYCLDTATRYPLGYYLGFEPPSYLTVMECLHHAILPKKDVRAKYGTEHAWLAYGIPATLVIDNGKEFIGHDLEDACCLLGWCCKTPGADATVQGGRGAHVRLDEHAVVSHVAWHYLLQSDGTWPLQQRPTSLCLSERSGQDRAPLSGGHLRRAVSRRLAGCSRAMLGRENPFGLLRPRCPER